MRSSSAALRALVEQARLDQCFFGPGSGPDPDPAHALVSGVYLTVFGSTTAGSGLAKLNA